MPYVSNEGIRIYYEVEGEGAPLVLHHSLTRSLEAWQDFGYVQKLVRDYQLILIDARGHGASDKPHDPGAYRTDRMVGDLVAVLDDLGISRTHYYGYSLGALIGFRITKYALTRFQSLILGGGNPYGFRTDEEKQFLGQVREAMRMGAEQGMEAVVAFLEKTAGPMPPEAKARVLANDPRALLAVVKALEEWPSAEDILPTMTLPCLVYAGEADPFYSGARECVDRMPNGTFISLPGLGHTPALYRSGIVLPHVTSFLATVSRAS
jgi:pimeloyl-ACP methyl ester carboxylesterase